MRLLYLLLSLVFCNCTSSKTEATSIQKFPKKVNLSHEKIQTPNLYMVANMKLMEDVLLIADIKSDKFFHAIELSNFSYLGSYIKRGNGPNEEVYINPFFSYLKGNKFLYRGKSSIKIVEINSKKNELNILEKINIPSELFNFQHLFCLDTIEILGVGDYPRNKEFISYNRLKKSISEFGPAFPDIGIEISKEMKNAYFGKIISIKPDRKKFAAVHDRFPIFRIYKKSGELVKELRYENGQDFKDMNDVRLNFTGIKTTNKYIYTLYCGKENVPIDINGQGDRPKSTEIFVWDWDGNPIKRLILDIDLFAFDISPDDSYIIGSNLESLNALYKIMIN